LQRYIMTLEKEIWRSERNSDLKTFSPLARIPFQPSESYVLILCGITCVSIFLLDIVLMIGFAVSVLYVIPVIICIWSPKRRTTFLIAGMSSILTIIAIPLKPPGDYLFPLFNRPVSLIAIWTVAFLADWYTNEHKKAEQDVKEERDRLSSLINSISDEVWFADAQGTFTLANRSALLEFGLDSTAKGIDVKSMASSLEVFRSDGSERPAEEAPPLRALRGEVIKEMEEIVKNPVSGKLQYRQVSAAPVKDVNGNIIGSVSVVRDITERRKTEEQAKEANERLIRTLESITDGFLFLDRDWRYTYFNQRGAEIIGMRVEDLLGKIVWDLFPHAKEGKFYTEYHKAMDTMQPTHFEEFYPEPLNLWLETHCYPSKEGLAVYFSDITERKTIEENLRRSNAELEQFAYVASHDLQEPLRMIIGHLGLLELKLSDRIDDDTRQNFEMAIAGGMRMKALIDDLLEYSRVESRGRPFEDVEMNEVVERAAQNIAKTMEEVGAELVVHPLPSIWADEMQMTQLVQNLLSNAMKFHGKEKPRVEISSTEMNAEIIFAVKDNGIGLNMAYADRIFQMFQRLNSGSKYPGTGIGLAIAKKIIERHSGRIWVESEEGKGATFFFSIPRKDGDVAPSSH